MTESFEVGATVCLKSGGPLMTVAFIGRGVMVEGQAARCEWIDSDGKPQAREYPVAALALDDVTPPPPVIA